MSFSGWRSASFLWTPSSLRAVAFSAACFFSPPAFAAVSTVSMGGFDVVYEDTTGAFLSVGFGGILLALGVVFLSLLGIAFAMRLWSHFCDLLDRAAFSTGRNDDSTEGALSDDEEEAKKQMEAINSTPEALAAAAELKAWREAREGGGAPAAEEGRPPVEDHVVKKYNNDDLAEYSGPWIQCANCGCSIRPDDAITFAGNTVCSHDCYDELRPDHDSYLPGSRRQVSELVGREEALAVSSAAAAENAEKMEASQKGAGASCVGCGVWLPDASMLLSNYCEKCKEDIPW